MFGGLKKIIKKNKKGFTKLVKKGVKVGVAIAAPIVAAKATSIGAKILTHAGRVKAKKEKDKKLGIALDANIAKPSIMMAASRETNAATNRPGGAPATGKRSGKMSATSMPGGASVKSAGAAANAKKGEPLAITGKVGTFLDALKKEKKSAQAGAKARASILKDDAARAKKQRAAENAAAKKLVAANKKAEKAATAAAKKAAIAAKKKAGSGGAVGTALSAAAGAVGIKAGKKVTAAKVRAAAQRKVQSAVRSAVRKSPGVGRAIPGIATVAGILAAGGKALDANAAAQLRKAEAAAGRKLTASEKKKLVTPSNPFAGK